MTRRPDDERLWFQIAPPISVAGRPAVVALLRRLVETHATSRWSPRFEDALRLGALTYQVAQRLVADLHVPKQLTSRRRWHRSIDREWLSVPAGSLVWGGPAPRYVQPAARTHAYVSGLPENLVDRALEWAPPVVVPFGRNGEHWVVACHVSALLARQRRPDTDVQVRRLQGTVRRTGTLPDVCVRAVDLLKPLFDEHRRFLAQTAVDDAEAQCLTGFSRAQCFRIRADGR